jgi:hypothetical protein
MQPQYRIRNWSEYNAGLKQRGSLTFWVEESVLAVWLVEDLSGKPGASIFYSDLAIMTMATLKAVYRLAGRQCQGFVESVFELMDIELPVPDHSTVSRRLAQLSVELPVVPKAEARHVVVDSTGVKVYGEGEWKTRQHGVSKRRTWRKLHQGVDEATGEILAAVATTNDYHDGEVLADVLDGIQSPLKQVTTDGAYDHRHCYDEIEAKGAKAVIPPRKGTPRFGSMVIVLVSRIHAMRTCARSVSRDANAGSKALAIIVARLQKQRCFALRRSLAATSVPVNLTIKQWNCSSSVLHSTA